MKTFTKEIFIDLIINTKSEFVIAKNNQGYYFTIKLNTSEKVTDIGDNSNKIFTQHWELVGTDISNAGKYFIFKMWGFPPTPMNNFISTMQFEGKQFKVSFDAIFYIVDNLKSQGVPDFQQNTLEKIEILKDYLFSK
jgi:hypothetical protein